MRVWRGGRYANDGGPLAVKCDDCGAEPGMPCTDTVDLVVKQNVHGVRASAAEYRGLSAAKGHKE